MQVMKSLTMTLLQNSGDSDTPVCKPVPNNRAALIRRSSELRTLYLKEAILELQQWFEKTADEIVLRHPEWAVRLNTESRMKIEIAVRLLSSRAANIVLEHLGPIDFFAYPFSARTSLQECARYLREPLRVHGFTPLLPDFKENEVMQDARTEFLEIMKKLQAQ
jgi:hypothetical protein